MFYFVVCVQFVFVFYVLIPYCYIKRPPPTFECRYKQAERERDSALEANRLFKQDFGDKIESLQVEVEQLTKHR